MKKKINILFLILFFVVSCNTNNGRRQANKYNNKIEKELAVITKKIKLNETEYEVAMERCGFFKILDLDLKSKKDLIEMKKIIKKSEKVFLDFSVKKRKLLNDFKTVLASLKTDIRVYQKDISRLKNKFGKVIKTSESEFKSDSLTFVGLKKMVNFK